MVDDQARAPLPAGGDQARALRPAGGDRTGAPQVGPARTPRRLWIDATFGVAGDMLLAALIDAGADVAAIQAAIDAVLPDTIVLSAADTRRHGLRATAAAVESVREDHPHRRWSEISRRLESAVLAPRVRGRALAAFGALARAEGRVHGVAEADVEFHEVGSWDSIADVVGVCAALEDLRVDAVTRSAITLGSGVVGSAHGPLPVPVPAVLELLRGAADPPTVRGDPTIGRGGRATGAPAYGELATPTGVALLLTLATTEVAAPSGRIAAVGVGAGTKDFASHANIVRVVLSDQVSGSSDVPRADTSGPADDTRGLVAEELVQLDTNVDDLDPRVWPSVLAALFAAGARDAWLTPILAKKGRPAHTLSVLADPALAGALRWVIVRETSAIGLRERTLRRYAVPRLERSVTLRGRPVRVKVSVLDGVVVQATAEYDDVALVAGALGEPVGVLLVEAHAAIAAAGLGVGSVLGM